ncbi:MAG: glycosyltransferase [Sedimenticola sp.]
MIDQKIKTIAVCVCSSGVRISLKACLTSLFQQELPGSFKMLVVVIDNSTEGNMENMLKDSNFINEKLVFCRESHPGIPFARNAAVREANRLDVSYIAFIDDDEIAPPMWLSRLTQGLIANDADVIVGEVVRCDGLDETIESANNYSASSDLSVLPIVKTAVTSNVLFDSRLVNDPLNLDFDEDMVFGGSDREFFMRVILAGGHIVAAKDELVFETWPKKRRQIRYLLIRWFRYGVSFNYRYCKNYSPVKGYTLVWLMSFYKIFGSPVKLLAVPIRRIWDKRSIKRLIGTSVADIAYGLGCIAPFFGISLYKYY